MARRSSLARWLPRPQVLLPILLVAFVVVWLTAFPPWYPHAPTDRAGAFGGILALVAPQWSHSRPVDRPKTEKSEAKGSLEEQRRP